MAVDPSVDLPRVEADELPDLEERDAIFRGEATDEPLSDAESFGEGQHVDECQRVDNPRCNEPAMSVNPPTMRQMQSGR